MREAQHLAHTLKGASGSISANRLYRATSKLDEALRAENQELSWRLLIDVGQSLDELVHAVNELFLQDKEEKREEIAISDDSRSRVIEQLEPIMKECAGLLGAFDPKAIDAFHSMKPQLDACGIGKNLAELEELVDAYNMKGALGVLNRIAEQLGISWK
jgi:hypothetical protein